MPDNENGPKIALVLRGIPGSGKSTIAGKQCRKENYYENGYEGPDTVTVCSSDDFFQGVPHLEGYHFDAKLLPMAHRTCFRKFVEAVQKGVPLVIVDNTNITTVEYAPYMVFADAYGYVARLLTVWVPLEVGIKRNVHRVPEKTVLGMYRSLVNEQVPPWFDHEVILGEF